MKTIRYYVILIVVAGSIGIMLGTGCASVMHALSSFAADPNASGAAEKGVEGAAGIAAFFGPVGGLIAGALSTGLVIWRRVKPTLAAAKTSATQAHAAGKALTDAIETFKAVHPDQWDDLGKLIEDQLSKQGIDPLVVKNVIRGLRGLPPLESSPA